MASMRSWDSEVITSKGSMPGSRGGHGVDEHVHAGAALGRGLRGGTGDARAAQVLHADGEVLASSSSRQASIRRFSSNGSPTCTLGRFSASASSSEKPAEASTDTPPMPSRPVVEPSSTARLPTPSARPSTSRSIGMSPRHSTLTSGLSA